MTRPDHEIVIADTKELWDDCLKVRIAVFIDEQGFSMDDEIDDYDPKATHILLRLLPSLTPIGTIRLYNNKLSRLAVLKDYRKYGFGKDLVNRLHDEAVKAAAAATAAATAASNNSQQTAVDIVCHSQLPVKAFYSRLGYISVGDEFEEDGAPHQKMICHIELQDI